MRLHIFHYHLDHGGVTRIINSQIRAFGEHYPEIQIKLYCGFCPDPEKYRNYGNTELIIDPRFNYLKNKYYDRDFLENEIKYLEGFIKKHIQRGDLLHFHNLNLGKNPVLTVLFNQKLRESGYHIFNHCHDFPEDRPEKLHFLEKIIKNKLRKDLQSILYPQGPNYKFGSLNSTDAKRIIDSGIPEKDVFLIPNPVYLDTEISLSKSKEIKQKICENFGLDPSKKLVTYPVRAINRKNIGELILLAVLFRETASFMITLPPKNPEEIPAYREWVNFSEREKAGVVFEAGIKADFGEIMVGSDYCITTSTMEGFGLAFMEPWVRGTPVAGRNLPNVTSDLIATGMRFPALYDRIVIPGSLSDFKDLSGREQKVLISDLLHNKNKRIKFMKLNPQLKGLFELVIPEVVDNNRSVILTRYSLENYANKLYAIYESYPG